MADPQDLRERIVGALGAVVAIALVIGVILGVLTYTAVHLTGLDHGTPAASKPARHHSSAQPAATNVHSSSPSPTTTPSPTHASPSPSHKPTKRAHKHKRAKRHHHRAHHRGGALTLAASPQRVSSMGRIDLHGRYPGHGGTSLAVQRLEGGHWQNFPVSATVRGGRFSTWVASGRHGPNRFRVAGAGHVSPAVTVFVG